VVVGCGCHVCVHGQRNNPSAWVCQGGAV
jgi:hypothetical protein